MDKKSKKNKLRMLTYETIEQATQQAIANNPGLEDNLQGDVNLQPASLETPGMGDKIESLSDNGRSDQEEELGEIVPSSKPSTFLSAGGVSGADSDGESDYIDGEVPLSMSVKTRTLIYGPSTYDRAETIVGETVKAINALLAYETVTFTTEGNSLLVNVVPKTLNPVTAILEKILPEHLEEVQRTLKPSAPQKPCTTDQSSVPIDRRSALLGKKYIIKYSDPKITKVYKIDDENLDFSQGKFQEFYCKHQGFPTNDYNLVRKMLIEQSKWYRYNDILNFTPLRG